MAKFRVYVLYEETIEADDEFEAERKALSDIEGNIDCEQVEDEEEPKP